MGGHALIEANCFEHGENPVTSRYSPLVGCWDLRDTFVGDGIPWFSGSDVVANAEKWQSTKAFPAAELTYACTPDVAAYVKESVTATAGATL